jgi:hypothetical protein
LLNRSIVVKRERDLSERVSPVRFANVQLHCPSPLSRGSVDGPAPKTFAALSKSYASTTTLQNLARCARNEWRRSVGADTLGLSTVR